MFVPKLKGCVCVRARTHARSTCARCGGQVIDYNIYTLDWNVKECVLHTYLTLEAVPGIVRKGVG